MGTAAASIKAEYFFALSLTFFHFILTLSHAMLPTLSFTLPTEQIVAVNLNLADPRAAQLLERIAAATGEGQRRAEIENRSYHMGAKPTLGLDYDDRLVSRLKCCLSTAYAYLELPVGKGGLRHARLGKKYLVTESAVREFLGDLKAAA